MWQKPYRPKGEITQPYNDGILTVYAVSDAAPAGYQPVAQLTKKVVLRFEERALGINRYYAGRQNQIKIERVLRVPRRIDVSTQDVVTVSGSETAYRIDLIQAVTDVYPPSMDLTLVRYQQRYEVIS